MKKKKINENIRKFRIFRNIKQSQLADLLGKSKNTISNWERGDNDPDPDTIEKICKILNVTPNQLFGWEPHKEYEAYERATAEKERHIMALQEKLIAHEEAIKSLKQKIWDERQSIYEEKNNDEKNNDD